MIGAIIKIWSTEAEQKRASQSKQINLGEPPEVRTWKAVRAESGKETGFGTRQATRNKSVTGRENQQNGRTKSRKVEEEW